MVWTTTRIRNCFLDFFKSEGHEIVPSGSLVPHDDPTLLFTNAGMVPFKNVFTGLDKRPYNTAASSQKCVRAGGKHNDLDNVGYTARHHTFFEMLGNFSFGDYFKERAIFLSWKLLTDIWGLDKDRLLVTVYHDDNEARLLWKKIAGLPDNRIISIDTSDNFWSMGDTGPCGPCSEIFYDHGPSIAGGPPGSPDQDGDRFVEIWNLVFMQYNQIAGPKGGESTRHPLPKPSIDTGMGLERIAAVLQGVHNNYDIDLFQNLIKESVRLTGVPATGEFLASHRVIADHLRSCSFLMADGVMPSNEGRGYVLRRIMRRAMRHAYLLGTKEPLMHRLVPSLILEMGDAYPGLERAKTLMIDTFSAEENRFRETLGRGLKLLDDEMASIVAGGHLAGDVAFKLYDTFGFPIDLTEDILKGRGLSVDMDGFDRAMERQRNDARASWVGSGDKSPDSVWFSVKEQIGDTIFLGYDQTTATGVLKTIVKDDKLINIAHAGDTLDLVLDQTPFYGESGGQMGDIGFLKTSNGAEIQVKDTVKRVQGLHVHRGVIVTGSVCVGDTLTATIDINHRWGLRHHHSATHLIHAVLRQFLGAGVVQKGSLVAHDRLRFDFSHGKSLTPVQMATIEKQVNHLIRQNTAVNTQVMGADDAIAAGAMALFGEKYGDHVRVVSMGFDVLGGGEKPYSLELCGGTHVSRTGDMGFMKILSESGVASGIRRIEAVVGAAAEEYINGQLALLTDSADALKTRPDDVPLRLKTLIDDKKRLEKTVKEWTTKGGGVNDENRSDPIQIGPYAFLGRIVANASAQDLKPMVDLEKKTIGSGIVALLSSDGDKGSIVVGVTDDLTHAVSAVDLVRIAAIELGGKGGGGRPDMAQAGGPNGAGLAGAIASIEETLKKIT